MEGVAVYIEGVAGVVEFRLSSPTCHRWAVQPGTVDEGPEGWKW